MCGQSSTKNGIVHGGVEMVAFHYDASAKIAAAAAAAAFCPWKNDNFALICPPSPCLISHLIPNIFVRYWRKNSLVTPERFFVSRKRARTRTFDRSSLPTSLPFVLHHVDLVPCSLYFRRWNCMLCILRSIPGAFFSTFLYIGATTCVVVCVVEEIACLYLS